MFAHIWSPSTFPWKLPTRAFNQALSCHHPHSKSSYSSLTSHPCHLRLSTGWHPIIHTPMLQMPKPPQSATPRSLRHICGTLYTQKTVQIHTALSILQWHSTHPSRHHSCIAVNTYMLSLHHCSLKCVVRTSGLRPEFIVVTRHLNWHGEGRLWIRV